MNDYLDQNVNPDHYFLRSYEKADHGLEMENKQELVDLYKMLTMGTKYPEQRMDLLEIFKFLKRQQHDKVLNNAQFGAAAEQNERRNRENKYLDPRDWFNGTGGWDYSPQYNMSGRRM